jgi:hypothetical protein
VIQLLDAGIQILRSTALTTHDAHPNVISTQRAPIGIVSARRRLRIERDDENLTNSLICGWCHAGAAARMGVWIAGLLMPNGAQLSRGRGRVFQYRLTPALWRSACRGRVVLGP